MRARMAQALMDAGFRVVSGGTDTHVVLLDVFSKGLRGKEAEQALDRARITVNKNAIPFDTNPPMNPSGIRLGSPAVTTRGFGEAEMREVGSLIADGADQHRERRGDRGSAAEGGGAHRRASRSTVGNAIPCGRRMVAHRHRCPPHTGFRNRHLHPEPGARAGRHRQRPTTTRWSADRPTCARWPGCPRTFISRSTRATTTVPWITWRFRCFCAGSRRTWCTSR